ncbi:MAG: class I adenylate-forming enzyme family protein [Hyphomicrobiales bacterium]
MHISTMSGNFIVYVNKLASSERDPKLARLETKMAIGQIRRWADCKPDALAVTQGSFRLSYREFLSTIASVQPLLGAIRGRRGNTVVVATSRLLEAWITSLAARSLGLNAIAIQTPSAIPDLNLSDIHCVLADGSSGFSSSSLGDKIPEQCPVIVLPKLAELRSDRNLTPEVSDAVGSQILYTTGTTGSSKKVVMDGQLEERRNQYRAECFNIKPSTVVYTDLPPSCGAGFKTPSAVWHTGGAVVFDRTLDLPSHLRRDGVNSVLAGPNQIRNLLNRGSLPDELKHSFEIVYTSGPFPAELAEATADGLTRNINIYFGATEIIGRPLRSEFRGRDDLIWLKPEPGRKIRIVKDTGEDCDINEEGKLAIELADVDARDYLDDPQTSKQVFRNDFFVPGDLAVKREDGRVRLLGRVADVIVIRGSKKPVGPIEFAIQSYLGAEEVCVFAELHETGQEEAIVAVRTERQITQPEMDYIARNLLPIELVRFARLNQFPRSEGAFGKTLRAELRKLLHATRPRPDERPQ